MSSTQISARAEELAVQLVAKLSVAGLTICSCESLTAGGFSWVLSSVPGASKVLRGGLVTYASDLKASLVKVPVELIERAGVINSATAEQMALGARELCKADLAISMTGVAGPDPQDGYPVGTVWLGFAKPAKTGAVAVTKQLKLAGDRAQIRAATIESALDWLISQLANY